MSPESDNKKLYRSIIAAVSAGDEDAFMSLLAGDIVDHDPIPRQQKGAAGFLGWMRTVRAAFPDFNGTIGELIAEGDLVAARVTWRGTHGGTFFGVEPTGREVSFQAMHILKMSDGLAVEWWGTADLYGALRQLGATVVASQQPSVDIPAMPNRDDQNQ
jgi:steroid delta-isomerase-like uncharacterized protein